MADLVPESEQQYGSILTVLGESAEQNGKMLKKPVEFTHIAFGDANDTYVQPDRKAQSLVNELYRIPVNSVDVLQPTPDSVPILKVEALIPDDIHDVVIREFAAVATFNGQSYFHAVGNCARVYVPNPVNNGQLSNPVSLEMTFVITSAEPIVEMDPNVITASREYVDSVAGKNWKKEIEVKRPDERRIYENRHYIAPKSSASNPVKMGETPIGDPNFVVQSQSGLTVFVEAQGIGGIIDDTQAFRDAIAKAKALQYVKRGVRVVATAPVEYYQISEPIQFHELWNIDFEIESGNKWNRAEMPNPEQRGGNIHWIGPERGNMFDFSGYCYGLTFYNVMPNGRGKDVLLYDFTGAIVARDITFIECGGVCGDFGAVYGGAGSYFNAGDIGPITWINPQFHHNKSIGQLNASGNAFVTIVGGMSTNNGYAPTIGNDFISDDSNLGYQLFNITGIFATLNHDLDAGDNGKPASGRSVRIDGGSVSLHGWDDTPGVISIETNGTVESIDLSSWRHFDGSMTRDNTPISISHGANCALTLSGGVALFGDVEIRGKNQALVVDCGLKFLHNASQFIGEGLDEGGLITNRASGFGEASRSVGGQPLRLANGLTATDTLTCRAGGQLQAMKARGSESPWRITSISSNGDYTEYSNAYRDPNTQIEYSVEVGHCLKKVTTNSGRLLISEATATSANQPITWHFLYGFEKGLGPNGFAVLKMSDKIIGYETPQSGIINRGSLFITPSATVGGKAFKICTSGGTVGSTAVISEFGTI
ncbi:TPA: phage tail protein [Vibrio vulnificus]